MFRGPTPDNQLSVHVTRSALLNEWGGVIDTREGTRSVNNNILNSNPTPSELLFLYFDVDLMQRDSD